jgi:hypothetical protein
VSMQNQWLTLDVSAKRRERVRRLRRRWERLPAGGRFVALVRTVSNGCPRAARTPI